MEGISLNRGAAVSAYSNRASNFVLRLLWHEERIEKVQL
jgi:hypothetical protein